MLYTSSSRRSYVRRVDTGSLDRPAFALGGRLEANFRVCPHCKAKGKNGFMMRMHAHTPVITRSDGQSFHLMLFDGPCIWYSRDMVPFAGRATAEFYYTADTLGQTNKRAFVVLRTTEGDEQGTLRAIEAVATLLAEILATGRRLEAPYFFDEGKLTHLSERARP